MELAELQDAEVGDGTTSVVILAAELLKRANELVRNRIHPTNIISGYRLAMREVGFCENCGTGRGIGVFLSVCTDFGADKRPSVRLTEQGGSTTGGEACSLVYQALISEGHGCLL